MSKKLLHTLIGLTTLVSSIMYIISDSIELLESGFSATQLYLTYAAFVLIPFFVLGLYALQMPQSGWLGLIGALAYGLAFIFYSGTAVYALTAKTANYEILVIELGFLYTFHGALLVIGATLFGMEIIRAKVLPFWTGITLIIGAILGVVINLMGLSDIFQVISSAIRSVAFIGMGIEVLKGLSAHNVTQ